MREKKRFFLFLLISFFVCFSDLTFFFFFLDLFLLKGVILWYASWWITAQPSFEPYFNLESTKRSNCSASPAMNMTLYAYFQNETEVKRVAMVRPVILTDVSLSNSLVIVQISFLFAYQTIVLGFNPIAKHRYVCCVFCVLCVFFFFLVLVGRSSNNHGQPPRYAASFSTIRIRN